MKYGHYQMIVTLDLDSGSLDRTWKDINDAINMGLPVVVYGGPDIFPVVSVGIDEDDQYYVSTAGNATFVTDSPDTDPVFADDGGGGDDGSGTA